MKIKPKDRKKLTAFLQEFYSIYPNEKHTVLHFVKYLKLRLKKNKDAWFGVSGDTAVGKSFFVIMVQILFGRPYDLTKNVTYIPKGNEIIEKFEALNFNTLLVDESAKEMRAVNWQNKSQQKVNVLAMTERFKNNVVFLNMPNFNEFTKSMRRGNLLFRAIVVYRTDLYARVIIQRRSRNWRSEDLWGDIQANKMYDKLVKQKKEITNEIILKIERAIPNTIMDFIVPNLEVILPNVTKEYERLKIESRKTDRHDYLSQSEKKNIYKNKYQRLLTKIAKVLFYNQLGIGKIKVTKQEFSESLGISTETFNKYLRAKVVKRHKDFRQDNDTLD